MIVYDLRCPKSHVFEGWFRDSSAYESQAASGELSCPVCGSHDIGKALMAPNIPKKSNAKREPARIAAHTVATPDAGFEEGASQTMASVPAGGPSPEVFSAAMKALRKLHDHVEKNCDYVGDNFAEEARKIHYGESDPRGIYGETTIEEARELHDEGIDAVALPRLPREDA